MSDTEHKKYLERMGKVDLGIPSSKETKWNPFLKEILDEISHYGHALSDPRMIPEQRKAYRDYLIGRIKSYNFDEPTETFGINEINRAQLLGEIKKVEKLEGILENFRTFSEKNPIPLDQKILYKRATQHIIMLAPKDLRRFYFKKLKRDFKWTKDE